MAAKRKSNDVWGMKKLRLLSLVGITSFALAHAGLAAGHGGGGGGGFHRGFAGGGFHGGGFRGSQFSSMRGGHMFGRGGFHGGGFHGRRFGSGFRGGRFGDRHHRFHNNVIFFDNFGFPGWWAWGYPYGYYGPYHYPYDYYGYGRYGY